MDLLYKLSCVPEGTTTISDIGEGLAWLFYLPGNLIISFIAASPDARYFFEITEKSGNATASLVISIGVWFLLYILYGVLSSGKSENEDIY